MIELDYPTDHQQSIEPGPMNPYMSFQNGHTMLEFDRDRFDAGDAFEVTKIDVPQSIDISDDTLVETESGIEMLHGETTDKTLRIMRLNAGADKKMLIGLSWSETLDSDGTKHKLATLATLLPEFELVAVEKLGVGKSSKPDRKDNKRMRKNASFGPHGAAEAKILDENDEQFDAVYGGSMGSRFALGYAANTKSKAPKDIIIEDTLGGKKYPFFDFATKRFMGKEGEFTRTYMNDSTDEKAVELWKESAKPLHTLRFIGRTIFRGQALQFFYTQIQAMRKSGLATDMLATMRNMPDDTNIHAGIPTASAVTDTVATVETIELATSLVPKLDKDRQAPQNVAIYLMPGATHSHTQANAITEAMIIRNRLGLDEYKPLAA